jgi:hypothetical protein
MTPPPLTLCRIDSNLRHFIRRPDGWLSVDRLTQKFDFSEKSNFFSIDTNNEPYLL